VCLQAWAFIIAREVEAPQRFQAIQSHRAAQAILHQQTQYVAHLLETAVVAEDDGRHLLRSHSFDIWLFVNLTPKGVVFSFSFSFSFCH